LRYLIFFEQACSALKAGWLQCLSCGCIALLLAACATTTVRAQATNPQPATKPANVSDDYKISPADVLEVTVFQENDLKSVLRVSNEGTIVFPLIGKISVGGTTPQETALLIQERLAGGYLINPQVSVTVLEFSKRRFTVLGEVQKPGSYDMPDQEDVTVLQAIGIAGGYTRIANPSKVILLRRVDGKEKTFQLNAKSMANGHTESAVKVLPGDVITVSESLF
jgi:protein involved in polysaccharide export with SLBB domain